MTRRVSLYLVDRESEVLKSGAEKVSTLQVEAALYEHPRIAEAAVFGIPHPVLGTAIAAAVVPRGEVVPSELRAFLAGRLASHQLPSTIHVRDALPHNENGKVLKRALRDQLIAEQEGN
ncbi:AMP-binding enzyme [Fodinicola feengrottensis]|uniref:AMP-binding enzyme n=1 Tax=Fodinicola feengrottensis TaxID=435914 RepID=UPI0024434461|nr:hypothetical protein [Fodinicola feengrottensis]